MRATEASRRCSASVLDVKAGEAVGRNWPQRRRQNDLDAGDLRSDPAARGSDFKEGTDVLKTPEHRIVSLGIAHVPENRRLFPRLTVQDNLKMGAFMPEARARYASGWRLCSICFHA